MGLARDVFEVLANLEAVLRGIRADVITPNSQEAARILLEKITKTRESANKDLKDYIKREGKRIRRDWILGGKRKAGKRR